MELNVLKLLNLLWYICLLASALAFVRIEIDNYIEGSTAFSKKHEMVTLGDLPTLTACWYHYEDPFTSYIYEQDLSINITVMEKEEKTVTLVQNQSVKTLYGLEFHLSEIAQRFYPRQTYQCFKISPKWDGKEVVDIQSFEIKMLVKFSDQFFSKFYPELLECKNDTDLNALTAHGVNYESN